MLTIPSRGATVRRKQKSFGNHEEYLSRIAKSLYYVELPTTESISLPVTELAAEIFSETKGKFSLSHLDIEEAANLSHDACVSPCSLVLALLYLDRLKSTNPKYLAKVSPSELFLISLMVGSKFLQDDGEEDEVNNYEWAASAGIMVEDINRAEKEFLDAIKWEVYVSEQEFWNRLRLLESKIGLRQGCKRGWFTYSELHLLLELIDLTTLIQSVWTVTAACLTSYAASVLALVGSTLLVTNIPGLGLRPKVPIMNNQCQEWVTNASTPCIFSNLIIDQNSTQDCSIASSLERLNESDLTNSDVLKLCQNEENEKDSKNCVKWNPLALFFLKLEPNKLIDFGHSLIENFKTGNELKLLSYSGSNWKWTNVIRNYLLKDSVPAVLFPIASF